MHITISNDGFSYSLSPIFAYIVAHFGMPCKKICLDSICPWNHLWIYCLVSVLRNSLRSKVMFSMLWQSFDKFSKLLKPLFLSLSFTNTERMTHNFYEKQETFTKSTDEVLYLQYTQSQETPRIFSAKTFPNAQCDNTNKSCLTSLLHLTRTAPKAGQDI